MRSRNLDHLLDFRVDNDKDIEMREKGFEFLTNLDSDHVPVYIKVATECGIEFRIEDEVYARDGSKIERWSSKSFYIKSGTPNKSEFLNIIFSYYKEGLSYKRP